MKFQIGEEKYDAVVDAIYSRFAAQFEFELLNSKNQLAVAKEQLIFWKKVLLENNEDADRAQIFATLFPSHAHDFDKTQSFISALLEEKEEENLKSLSEEDKILLATLKGLFFYLDKVNATVDTIIKSGNISVQVPVIGKETILSFKSKIDDYREKYYEWMILRYNSIVIDVVSISKFSTELEYAHKEQEVLNRLVGGTLTKDDIIYLMHRLELSETELEAIVNVGAKIRTGGYTDILSGFKVDEQKDASRLLAIREFLNFLLNRIAELQFKNKAPSSSDDLSDKPIIKSFHWKDLKTRETKLAQLYLSMTAGSFISPDTNPDVFIKAFSGSVLSSPLNIRWMILTKDRRFSSKPSLFYFLNKLIENGFVVGPTDNKELFNMIQHVFVDKDGKPFENLQVSLSGSKSTATGLPVMAEEIDKLISELKR